MSKPSPRTKFLVVLALSMVLCVGASQAATKATLVFAKQAKSKGEIVFGITPQGGEMQEITITVVAKMGASEVASAVAKEFEFLLSDTFKIAGSGAKVTIKPVEKKATFEVKIVNQTVQGISVTIK
jgi:uncharacterized protein (DUF2141 family)